MALTAPSPSHNQHSLAHFYFYWFGRQSEQMLNTYHRYKLGLLDINKKIKITTDTSLIFLNFNFSLGLLGDQIYRTITWSSCKNETLVGLVIIRMSRDIEVMRDISSHVFIQTMSKIIRWTRGTCLSAFVKTKKSLHLEYVHYHPIKSFQSVEIQKQTRWSVKNWRDLPTVPLNYRAGWNLLYCCTNKCFRKTKQYKGYVSQKNMIYFSAFDDQMAVRK